MSTEKMRGSRGQADAGGRGEEVVAKPDNTS